ncbi:MAG: iron ABC transporter permease [Pseudomonadota bacterium]
MVEASSSRKLATDVIGNFFSTVAQLNAWVVLCWFIVLLLLVPIASVVIAAFGTSSGLWLHLSQTVLPRYLWNTLALMAGVSMVALVFGVTTAWAVTRYDFPARRTFELMLLLPAAVPAYLIAYTYTDFLEYAGPVQGGLRDLFGWRNARDYWFPEIRSLGGAWLVMGAVLYPYVFMMARAAFLLTPASYYETAMVSGRNVFWGVAIPLARPAIVAGLALVLMEVLSDFGTVEYFAIETLTLGIFNVWLGMNSLATAAQLSLVAFIFVAALLIIEQKARSRRRYADKSRRARLLAPARLLGWKAALAVAVCAIPILVGFILPVGILLSFVVRDQSLAFNSAMILAAQNSLLLAAVVTLSLMMLAAYVAVVANHQSGNSLARAATIGSLGYAFPGTILAIGVIVAAGFADRTASGVLGMFGIAYSGWLVGSLGLLVCACVCRFMAVGYGAVVAGHARIPPNLTHASRTLGQGMAGTMSRVVIPLLARSVIAGGVLVFVDVMKELPMTLLLRPFNFETLATYVYQFAKDELLEEAALPALLIILAGIPPVFLMNAALRNVAK